MNQGFHHPLVTFLYFLSKWSWEWRGIASYSNQFAVPLGQTFSFTARALAWNETLKISKIKRFSVFPRCSLPSHKWITKYKHEKSDQVFYSVSNSDDISGNPYLMRQSNVKAIFLKCVPFFLRTRRGSFVTNAWLEPCHYAALSLTLDAIFTWNTRFSRRSADCPRGSILPHTVILHKLRSPQAIYILLWCEFAVGIEMSQLSAR